jgi:hypothetical protein
MRFFFFLLFFSFFLLLFSSHVQAIGMSPPLFELNYEEGKSFTFSTSIINRGGPTTINLYADRSELSEFVTFSKNDFDMAPGTKETIELTITCPPYKTLTEFGLQKIGIHAREIALNKETGTFAAVTAVEGLMFVHIPVPGVFGEITDFSISNVIEGLDADLTLELTNRGTDDLKNTKATVTIVDFYGEDVSSVEFSNIDIPVGESKKIRKELSSSVYPSGKYFATAEYVFSDSQAPQKEDAVFFIGSSDVIITDYTKNLTEGQINVVYIELQSLWGSPLNTIRGSLIDFTGRQKPLPVIDLEPFSKRVVELYLDVPLLNSSAFRLGDEYNSTTKDLDFHLQFPVQAANDVDKTIPLTFTINRLPVPEKERAQFFTTTNTILIIGMIVLILIAFLLLLIFKKGSDSKKH